MSEKNGIKIAETTTWNFHGKRLGSQQKIINQQVFVFVSNKY